MRETDWGYFFRNNSEPAHQDSSTPLLVFLIHSPEVKIYRFHRSLFPYHLTPKALPSLSISKSVCLQSGRPRFDPCVGKILWRRKWQPTPVTLSWKIPWTEEPGKPQSMRFQRVEHDWLTSLFPCLEAIVHKDLRAQEEDICHYFHFSPLYLPWSHGARCHDLSFFNI